VENVHKTTFKGLQGVKEGTHTLEILHPRKTRCGERRSTKYAILGTQNLVRGMKRMVHHQVKAYKKIMKYEI
jgi:hypothetical protein